MKKISEHIDLLIQDMKKRKQKPEYVIMGRNLCTEWLIEMSREGLIELNDVKKYKFNHRGVPVIVCESEILEVAPNAKYLMEG
ncbi:MAG: hypothetical protein CVV44_16220 [Spirochaetae bacterium HGW-Spirochaetae-1]|jgi:hypothetical protein|nr:MAG: hypothetical protein CVV44_16220 [Spirochaetae bacterium HGW-Spirochaetae-1]